MDIMPAFEAVVLGSNPGGGTMDLPNCCYRVSVKALVLDESRTRFLVVREDSGKWEFPGGGIEHGVDVHDELRREIQEEMGLPVTFVADAPCYFLKGVNTVGTPTANVFYETSLAHLEFISTEECREVRFVNSDEARRLRSNENLQTFANLFNPSKHH